MYAHKVKKSNSLANNTQQKFKAELGNRSFETVSGILRKNGSQLKQTKLSLCQKENKLIFSGFVEEPIPTKLKQEFVYMPPKKLLKQTTPMLAVQKSEPLPALPTSSMSKPGRNLRSLIGRVDFCIKLHKAQPDLNVIWNVYGKLLRIIVGKRGENTLLLRNDDKGPILQSIFYDFDGELKSLNNGCYVHVVGRFTGENRLNTFSVTQVSTADWQQNLTRVENLTSYILMQNTMQTN